MRTVLVVDDDPVFVDSLGGLLEKAGYRVLCAPDGSAALNVLDQRHKEIDLAIVDLALPTINGFELVGAIARRPGPMKIIATTSVYKEYHLDLVRTLGAHAVIRKPPPGMPLPESQWLEAVSRLIGREPDSRPAGQSPRYRSK